MTTKHWRKLFCLLIFPFVFSCEEKKGETDGARDKAGQQRANTGNPFGAHNERGSQGANNLPLIANVEISQRFRTISMGGRLQPKAKIFHQAAISGYILSMDARTGQEVRQGDKLFSIKQDDVTQSFKPRDVLSRIGGRVSDILAQTGSEVRAGDNVVAVIDVKDNIMEALASDKDAFLVEIGQKVEGYATGGTRMTGYLMNRSPEPDYATGLFSLTFQFPEQPDHYVGEYVVVELPVEKTMGIFISKNILVRRYGGYYVWLVNASDELESREITIGTSFGDSIKVETGLKVKERYLTRITGQERAGAKVKAQDK